MFNTNCRRDKDRRRSIAVLRILLLTISAFLIGYDILPAADIYIFTDEQGNAYYTNAPGQDRLKARLPLFNSKGKKRLPAEAVLSSAASSNRREKNYQPMIVSASRLYAVDPDIVRAVIKAESDYNDRAVSYKGAQGLMQLMPKTARELVVADPFDPASNINGGVSYLSQLLGSLKGNLPLALAAYNAGLSRVVGHNELPAIEETRRYVQRVLNYYISLKGRNEI
jgi:soluble lytic murein transglycosylase-like protein